MSDRAENADDRPLTPGLFVHVEQTSRGPRVAFECIDGFDPLMAPTVLELAAQAAYMHLGLPARHG